MKSLLNLLSTVIFILIVTSFGYAQCTTTNWSPLLSSSTTLDSKFGVAVPGSGTIRVLIVFAEIDYDTGIDPNPNSTAGWSLHSLPTWKDDLFDANVPSGTAQGTVTRYFQEASFGTYNVIGDYLLSPTNGGIFSILQSDANANGYNQAASSVINTTMGSNFVTGHGLNDPAYFDNWTNTGAGAQKIASIDSPHKYDHVIFIWRNRPGYDRNGNTSAGSFGASLFGFTADTHMNTGSFNAIPTDVIRHEFSHHIFGGNDFHCGGGGWYTGGNYWVSEVAGWSGLGLHGCSLLSWNAWDRQRMSWTAPGNTFNPSARNSTNTGEVNGDLDTNNPADAGVYRLRDFITTGDAIRIKLPFTNPATEYPQWIWVENHNGTAINGSDFDQWQYQNDPCVAPAIPGLYMYLQIDRDIRQGTYSEVYNGFSDYLRPITAEGFFDRTYEDNVSIMNTCVAWTNTHPFRRLEPNPLTGYGDQENDAVDLNNDGFIFAAEQKFDAIEDQNGTYALNLFQLGHSRNVFTLNGNHKLGVGTNPSSASMMNLVSYDPPIPTVGIKNLRKIYLNGVSIEILNEYSNHDIQVQVRFDDIDVNNNVRWCADEIVLSPVQSPNVYSLNVKNGKTITLDQGTTPTRISSPQNFNGQDIFVSPTVFRCTSGSNLHLEQNSIFDVTNGSELRLEDGSTLEVEDGAKVIIGENSKLTLSPNSNIIVHNGGQIYVQSGGTMEYNIDAQINLADDNSKMYVEGNWLIKANAIFTFTGSGYLDLTPTHQLTMEPSSQIKLNGQGHSNRVLRLDQAAQLSVTDRILDIRNGLIDYDGDANIKVSGSNAQLYIQDADLTNTNGTYYTSSASAIDVNGASYALLKNLTASDFGNVATLHDFGSSSSSIELRNLNFSHCVTGVVISDVQCGVNDYSSVISSDKVSFSATNVKRVSIVGSNFSFSGNVGSGYTPTSLYLKNTVAYLHDCDIHDNALGIDAAETQLWIYGTYVRDNKFGIHMTGSITTDKLTNQPCFTSMLTASCGWFIDNSDIAIQGHDFLLNIDAQFQALYNCDHRTRPNRFDGNAQIFDVCYDPSQTIISEVEAKGNYWDTDISGNGTDVKSYNLSGWKADIYYCNPQHGQYALNSASYLTSCIPTDCYKCSTGQNDCSGWTTDKIEQYINDNAPSMSCKTNSTTSGHSLQDDFIAAMVPFNDKDDDGTREVFAPVAAVELTKDEQGWKDADENILSNDCVHMVRVAQVLYQSSHSQARMAKADNSKNNKVVDTPLSGQGSIAIIPNPTVGEFQIKVTNSTATNLKYRITNVLGQEIATGNILGSEKVNLSSSGSGVYFISVYSADKNENYKTRVVIQ